MANIHDTDTAVWLHNKLGSAEELWIPSSISGIIKTTKIDNILRCFHVLTTTVKVKLLLGILHLPRRNLDEMKHTIGGIIEKALEDSDLWVQLVANMVKMYPTTVKLNLDLQGNEIAESVINQLREKVPDSHQFSTLPLECKLVNKLSLQNLVGNLPQPDRHFTLKKKPKSAALRAEFLKKATEARNQMKKIAGGVKVVPVKHRDMTRRTTDITPMKGISSRLSLSRNEGFRSNSTPSSATKRMNHRQQAGGTKLLDISEQPIAGRDPNPRDAKRRKKHTQQPEAQAQDVNEIEEESEKARLLSTPSMESTEQRLGSVDESEIVKERDEFDDIRQQQSSVVEPSEIFSDDDVYYNDNQDGTSVSPAKRTGVSRTSLASSFDAVDNKDGPSGINTTAQSDDAEEPEQPLPLSPKQNEAQHRQQRGDSDNSSVLMSPSSDEGQMQGMVSPPQQQFANSSHHNISVQQMSEVQRITQQQQQQQQQPFQVVPPNNGQHLQARMVIPIATNATGTSQQSGSAPQQQQYFQARISSDHPQLQQQRSNDNPSQQQINLRQQQMINQQQQQRLRQQQQQQQQQNSSVPVGSPPAGTPKPAEMAEYSHQMQSANYAKKSLTLTRDQMFEAQEIFRHANCLSRPEKAVILGFIAGSRENPYPEQGDIVRIVITETPQNVQSNNGEVISVLQQTLLELNYNTGQLLKKQRYIQQNVANKQ